jgi:hypothetical protein
MSHILNKELGFEWNLSRAVPVKTKTVKQSLDRKHFTDIHRKMKEAKNKARTAKLAAENAVSNQAAWYPGNAHNFEIRTPMSIIEDLPMCS